MYPCRWIAATVVFALLGLAAGEAGATDCSASAFQRTPRGARSALAALCLAETAQGRGRVAPEAPAAPGTGIDNGGSQPQRGLREHNGSVAFRTWDVVERDDGSLTILLDYYYDGARGEAWIGAQPLVRGKETALFGYAPAQALVGTGLVQVHVSLVKDRATPLCTDALKVNVYRNNPFHEAVLPYRHCWQKAPHGPTDPLVPRSQPEHQNLRERFNS